MMPRLPLRVLGLAIGAGALAAGLVMTLLGVGLGEDYLGLATAGLVIAAFGLVLAVAGAFGFAFHGPVRPGRE